jgi:2'-5' RNA ligase
MEASVRRISEEIRRTPLPVRWVDPANIHLTVVFMGSLEEDLLDPVREEVEKAIEDSRAFQVDLSSAGIFGTVRNPRVLWLGLKGDIERMGKLRDRLQRSLAAFGIKEEDRPFRPHLTLGRFKEGAKGGRELEGILDKYRYIGGNPCTMGDLVLYKSDLRAGGPVYSPIYKWSMKEERPL